MYGSAKMQLAHTGIYTQKTKCSLTTAVLQALVPKAITVPQAKRLVQLDISYQTLQDIRCASYTDANSLADKDMKPISPCGPDPNLRSRALTSALIATFAFVFVFLLLAGFSKNHHISKGNH